MTEYEKAREAIESGSLNCRELAQYCRHEFHGIRGAAILELVRTCHDQEFVIRELRDGALDEDNRRNRVFGAGSLAHLCVRLLMDMNNTEAKTAAAELIRIWPDNDRDYLEMVLYDNQAPPDR